MKLSQKLQVEINASNSAEPNVLIFVDESSIFWVSNEGHYVWLAEHKDIADYIDESHHIERLRPTSQNVEGVRREGVYWMNSEFESPFHVSDFISKIETINTNTEDTNTVLVLEGSGVNPSGENKYYSFDSVDEAEEWMSSAKDTCMKNYDADDETYSGWKESEYKEYVNGSYELIENPNDWELAQVEEAQTC